MCTPVLSLCSIIEYRAFARNAVMGKIQNANVIWSLFFFLKNLYWRNMNRNHGVDCQVKQETLLCNLESRSFRGKLTKIVVIGLLDGQVV